MDPFELLNDEHRLIEQTLGALVRYTRRLDEGAAPADLSAFVTFFQRFADALHHHKEEDILFERMIEAGFPRGGGPIAMMLHEHEGGRHLVSRLAEAAARADSWLRGDHAAVHETALVFAELLRAHIHKEDAVLYPMARRTLPEDVIAEMGARFEAMEASDEARAERASLVATATALVTRYG